MTRLTTATAMGVILASSPVWAEATPQSVWEDMNGYYETMGLTVETDAVEDSGNTLTVRGLVLSQKADDSEVTINLGDSILTSNDDGSVRLDTADEATIDIVSLVVDDDSDVIEEAPAEEADSEVATDTGPKQVRITATMQMPEETINIRKDGDALAYDFEFPTANIILQRVEVSGGDVYETPATITLTNMKGSHSYKQGDLSKVIQTGTVATAVLDLDVKNSNGASAGTITFNELEYNSNSVIPKGENWTDNLDKAVKDGLDISGQMKIADTSGKLNLADTSGDTPQTGDFAWETGEYNLEGGLSSGQLRYAGNLSSMNVEANVPDLPVPVEYSVDSASFEIMAPVTAGEEQPFKLAYKLDGVEVGDSLWGMFDPEGKLPHDPASMALDIDGTARLDVSLFDTEALSNSDLDAPGEVSKINVNSIALAALGADMNVTGKLVAPENGDISQPVGTLNGRISGLNAALDKLVEAGILQQEQIMGPMMMMAMFAKPDPDEEGVMTSEIEFRDNGEIHANGQRIK